MSLQDELAEAREELEHAVNKLREFDEPVVRYALYQVARHHLDGRIKEITWTEPPFPEGTDHE